MGGAGAGRGDTISSYRDTAHTGTGAEAAVQDLPAATRFTVQRHVFLMPANIRNKFKCFTFIALLFTQCCEAG